MKSLKKIAKTDVLLWVIIVFASVLHLQKHLQDLIFNDFPPALDPYLFATQSLALVKGGWNFGQLAYSVLPATFLYPPLTTFLGSLVILITGQPALTIYTWLGPLLGALLIPFSFLSFRGSLGKVPALITAIAIGFSSIILNRTLLTLPENIGFFFLIAFLGLFLKEQKQVKNFWTSILILLFAGALTHFTIVYIPLILGAYFLFNPKRLAGKISPKSLIVLGTVIAIVLLLPWSPLSKYFYAFTQTLLKLLSTSSFGFAISLDQLVHFLQNIFIILGVFGGFLAIKNFRDHFAQKLLLVSIIFGGGVILFQSQSLSFGAITPDRFYPFLAIALALLTGYLAMELSRIFKWFNWVFLLLLVILIPFYSYRGWDYTFTKDEFEAATWLKNTPEDSVVVSSAILSWLIPAAGEREIFWKDPYKVPLVTLTPQEIKDKIESDTDDRPVYIFISKNKLSNCFVGLKTDGYFTQCHDNFVPEVNLNNFADLPLVYANQSVLIYELK